MSVTKSVFERLKKQYQKPGKTYKPPVNPVDIMTGMGGLTTRTVKIGKPVAVNVYRKAGPVVKRAAQVIRKRVKVNRYR